MTVMRQILVRQIFHLVLFLKVHKWTRAYSLGFPGVLETPKLLETIIDRQE